MCKVPARERTQENAPPKYKGAHIPSKAFNYLQYLTQNETTVSTSNTTNNSANNFSNPLPASYINAPSNLEFASVQVFDTPSESENKKNYFKINAANNNASFPNPNNHISYQNTVVEVNSDVYVKNDSNDSAENVESSSANKMFESNKSEEDTMIVPEQDVASSVADENIALIEDNSSTFVNDNNNNNDSAFTTLPKSASFVEIVPAKEIEPCLNEPNIPLTFSNNEIINESVDLNDIKESASVNGTDADKPNENEGKPTTETSQNNNTSSVFETQELNAQTLVKNDNNDNNSKSNDNENQVSTNAQEIETSEF